MRSMARTHCTLNPKTLTPDSLNLQPQTKQKCMIDGTYKPYSGCEDSDECELGVDLCDDISTTCFNTQVGTPHADMSILVSIGQHGSSLVSMGQHWSALVSIGQNWPASWAIMSRPPASTPSLQPYTLHHADQR